MATPSGSTSSGGSSSSTSSRPPGESHYLSFLNDGLQHSDALMAPMLLMIKKAVPHITNYSKKSDGSFKLTLNKPVTINLQTGAAEGSRKATVTFAREISGKFSTESGKKCISFSENACTYDVKGLPFSGQLKQLKQIDDENVEATGTIGCVWPLIKTAKKQMSFEEMNATLGAFISTADRAEATDEKKEERKG
jgi:hypothetical protein